MKARRIQIITDTETLTALRKLVTAHGTGFERSSGAHIVSHPFFWPPIDVCQQIRLGYALFLIGAPNDFLPSLRSNSSPFG